MVGGYNMMGEGHEQCFPSKNAPPHSSQRHILPAQDMFITGEGIKRTLKGSLKHHQSSSLEGIASKLGSSMLLLVLRLQQEHCTSGEPCGWVLPQWESIVGLQIGESLNNHTIWGWIYTMKRVLILEILTSDSVPSWLRCSTFIPVACFNVFYTILEWEPRFCK